MKYEPSYYEIADQKNKYTRFPGNVIAPFLKEHLHADMRMLEVGCGTAGIIRELDPQVAYDGLEISEYAVEQARKEWVDKSNAHFVVGTSEKLPFPDAMFDCVLMFYTLEHFKQPQQALLEAMRVLKANGRLVIIAPNHEFPSVPPTLRFKSTLYRFWFFLMRVTDYLVRVLGVLTFRVLQDNMTDAKGVYEKKDDDLWHVVSTWEVVKYLQEHGATLEKFWEEKALQQRRRGKAIAFVRLLPTLRWFGVPMVASFVKK